MSAVASRIGALLAAVLVVVAAVAIRNALDDAADSNGPPVDTGGPVAVSCAADLADVCTELAELAEIDLTVEPAGTTTADLRERPAGDLVVWVTLEPMPAMVDDVRERAGLGRLLTRQVELARSPLVLVVWDDRAAVLEAACGAVTWDCVGRVAAGSWEASGGERSWGPVKPGHGSPMDSAVGLLVAGQATASRLAGADFSLRDLQDDTFRGWWTTLERSVPDFNPSAGSHLRQQVQFGRSVLDVVGTTQAEVNTVFARVGARAAGLGVVPGDPAMSAVLIVAGSNQSVVDRLAQAWTSTEAQAALTALNWEPASATPAPTQLPAPGALEALQQVWTEAVR